MGVRERVKHSQSEVSPTSEQPSRGSEMITMPCSLQRDIQAAPQCTGEGEGAISDTGSTTVYRRGGGGNQ